MAVELGLLALSQISHNFFSFLDGDERRSGRANDRDMFLTVEVSSFPGGGAHSLSCV